MTTVKLGDHVVPVVAQRHARVRHLLTSLDTQALFGQDYGPQSYRLLCKLVPALEQAMPEWEWDGYASEEAAKKGEYDPDKDRSPLTSEIVDAFEAVLKTNGGDRLGNLLGLARDMRGAMEAQAAASSNGGPATTPTSPASPGSTGA